MGCKILRLGPLTPKLKAGEKKVPWILARGKKVRRPSWRNGCEDNSSFSYRPIWSQGREVFDSWDSDS